MADEIPRVTGECSVCFRQKHVVPAISAFTRESKPLCAECLQRPAESLGVFRVQLEASKPDPLIKKWYTWIDGKYVHWDNFVLREKSK